MHLKLKEKDKKIIISFIDWLMYMIGYVIVFMVVTSFFKSVYIDSHSILYSILIVLIIYILNKTIKPMLVSLTIPITGLTLGLFYPFINLFILKLVDIILGKHFQLKNIYIAFFVACILSIMNIIMEKIIKTIITRMKHHV